MSNSVSVHIDAKSTVRFHCDHPTGDVSLILLDHPKDHPTSPVYLCGTLDELERFADRITDATARLRGEARLADLLAEVEAKVEAKAQRQRTEAVQ